MGASPIPGADVPSSNDASVALRNNALKGATESRPLRDCRDPLHEALPGMVAYTLLEFHVADRKRTRRRLRPLRSPALFHRFARRTSDAVASPFSFALALAAVVCWATLGPRFGFSDTWQLVINTGTTIITF